MMRSKFMNLLFKIINGGLLSGSMLIFRGLDPFADFTFADVSEVSWVVVSTRGKVYVRAEMYGL